MSDLPTPETLPATFFQLGGVLLGEDTLDELLQRVVHLARETLPSAYSVSISVSGRGRVHTSNSTGSDAAELDQAQYEGAVGPCLAALEEEQQLEVDVAGSAERWPQFSAKAAELGVRTVLSTPLRVRNGAIGTLNLYSRGDMFSVAERRVAQLFAEQAAVLLANAFKLLDIAETNEQLTEALASREIIGEAKGILMERGGCDRHQAFDILRRASQRENRKLRELAEEVVASVEDRARPKS